MTARARNSLSSKANSRSTTNRLPIMITFVVIILAYIFCFAGFITEGVYDITPSTNNDRFFSMDDSYYVNKIYSTKLDDTGRIVKHPLLIAGAHYATQAEHLILGDISIKNHYIIIVIFQILISFLGIYYLYKILDKKYHLSNLAISILLLIYALSCSNLLYTFIVESYILSGTILILSYWCLLEKKFKSLFVLGILAGGVTITNFALWALMVLFLNDTLRTKLKVIVSSGVGLLITIAVLPIRGVFFTNVFKVFISSPQNYADKFDLLTAGKMGYYSLFGSTYMFIDTVNKSPFGEYAGKAISFVASAPTWMFAAMCVWVAGLIAAIIIGCYNKDKLLLIPMAVLMFSLVLHVLIQYGLKESFLYSLHHSFAQILIIGYLFKGFSGKLGRRILYGLGFAYLAVMVYANVLGGVTLIEYVSRL